MIYHGRKRHNYDLTSVRFLMTTYDIVRIDMNDPSSLLYKSQDK